MQRGIPIFSRKFLWLWIIVGFAVFTLSIWPLIGPSQYREGPSFVPFFERHYLSFKQTIARTLSAKRQRPEDSIEIFRIKLSSRAKMWLDPALKEKLVSTLESHSGPIYSNIEPEALSQDSQLKKILTLKNYIRDYRFQDGLEENAGIEARLAKDFSGAFATLKYTQLKRLRPENADYYDPNYIFGTSAYAVDLHSHFVYEYPLSVPGSQLQVPTLLATFLKQSGRCTHFEFVSTTAIECKPSGEMIANPMPLAFYDWSPAIAYSKEEIKNPNSILIVELYDGESLFSTFQKPNASWAEIFATALNNVIQNRFLLRPTWMDWIEVLMMAIGIALILFSASRLRLKTLMPVIMGCFLGLWILDVIATLVFRFYTHSIPEFLSLATVSLVALGIRAVRDFDERAKLERALTGYLSPSRLENLLSGRENLRLEGRKAELCTMIIDIVGFSKLAEKISAEEAFLTMRDFFSRVDPVIFSHHGFIDKKLGDGLIAVFGDDSTRSEGPKDFTRDAILAALKIQRILKESPSSKGYELKARIGINTGPVIIGNSGSEKHFNYTVIGETVNFTQRLEAACPAGSVLVSESAQKLTANDFEFKNLEIQVKGHDRLFSAFEVLGTRSSVK